MAGRERISQTFKISVRGIARMRVRGAAEAQGSLSSKKGMESGLASRQHVAL